jgi:hypothetical protein
MKSDKIVGPPTRAEYRMLKMKGFYHGIVLAPWICVLSVTIECLERNDRMVPEEKLIGGNYGRRDSILALCPLLRASNPVAHHDSA